MPRSSSPVQDARFSSWKSWVRIPYAVHLQKSPFGEIFMLHLLVPLLRLMMAFRFHFT